MIVIKLDYFTLLSPEPLFVHGVGNIKSPTLRDISKLENKINTFNFYVSLLLLSIDSYFENFDKDGTIFSYYPKELKEKMLDLKSEYDSLDKESQNKIGFFNFLIYDEIIKFKFEEAFNFFIREKVTFNKEYNIFTITNGETNDKNEELIIGTIQSNNYDDIVDLILQRINIKNENKENKNLKVKNKLAEKLLSKISKGKKENNKCIDERLNIGNMISSLSSHHASLNIVNIWDVTVYQLYDQFSRVRLDDSYKILSKSVSTWGDKDKKFDEMLWASLINKN